MSVAGAGCRHRISNQRDAAGGRSEQHFYDIRMHVHAVVDDLERDARRVKGCSHRAGSSVVDLTHGIERVGQDARASLKRGSGLGVGGGSVANRYAYIGGDELGDSLSAAGEFWGQRDLAKRAIGGGQQLLDLGRRGSAKRGRIVCTTELLIDKRPFEVAAQYEGIAVGEFRDRGQPFDESFVAIANERKNRPGGSVAAVGGKRRRDGVYSVIERDTVGAVTVDVDKAGSKKIAVGVGDEGGGIRLLTPGVTGARCANAVAREPYPRVIALHTVAHERCGVDDAGKHGVHSGE